MNALKLKVEDFDIDGGTPLGCGALATVNRCLHKPSGRHVAVKVLSKVQLLQLKKVEAVMAEKDALYSLGPHAGIVYLHGTTQSDDELYFVMELLTGGDLLEHIRRCSGLRRLSGEDQHPTKPVPCMRYADVQCIAAQLINVLEHVFAKGYVLRDLKPENIMFDADGRCVLIDFDTVVKQANAPRSNGGIPLPRDRGAEFKPRKVSEIQAVRKMTAAFCGTAHYIAPESLGECQYTFASDLFSLGCVIFHMLAGRPVFNGASSFFVMKDIKNGVAAKTFPPSVTSVPGAEALIRSLLNADPVLRCGVVQRSDGPDDNFEFDANLLRGHPFFDGFDWATAAYPPAVVRSDPFGPAPTAQREATRRPVYHDSPFHTDEYAAYVFQAGDSAFERFALETADMGEAKKAPTPPPPTYPPDEGDADGDDDAEFEMDVPANLGEDAAASDDDEMVSIEDDVGVSEAARHHQDFEFGNDSTDGDGGERSNAE